MSTEDAARLALECLAVEGYRTRRFSEGEVRDLLGYGTPMEVHALLAEHDVLLNIDEKYIRHEIKAADELQAQFQRSAIKAA